MFWHLCRRWRDAAIQGLSIAHFIAIAIVFAIVENRFALIVIGHLGILGDFGVLPTKADEEHGHGDQDEYEDGDDTDGHGDKVFQTKLKEEGA